MSAQNTTLEGDDINIGRRVAAGAAWMVLMRATVRSLGFVSIVVLARLLTPQDFGIVSIARATAEAIELLSEFNFDLALIRARHAGRKEYDTAWSLGLLRGIVIALALVIAAPQIASFFLDARLEPIFYWLAVWNVLHGVQNIGVVDFRKSLQLDKEFRFLVVPKIASLLITLPLAFVWQDYWALVAGIVGSKAVSVVASYWMHSYRPRFSLAAAHELFSFSKWTMFNGMIHFAAFRADNFFIGRFVGMPTVGLYNIAFEIANLPTTELASPIGRALYPGLSRFGDNLQRMRSAFLRVTAMTNLLVLPVGVGIGLTADLFVQILLGPKWLAAVPLIHVLLVFALCRIFYSNVYALILALGRPSLTFWPILPTILVQMPLLLFATPRYGAIGAAWSVAGGALLTFVISLAVVSHLLAISLREQLRVFWRPVVSVALMSAMVLWLRQASGDFVPIAELVVLAAAGAFSYTIVTLAFWQGAGCPDGAEREVLSVLPAPLRRRLICPRESKR